MAKNRADTDDGLEVILEKAVVTPYTRQPITNLDLYMLNRYPEQLSKES
jgi:hypothetical protein